MQYEVGTTVHGRQHRHHTLLHRLAVGQFGRGERAGTTQRQIQATRQLPHHHRTNRGLRCAKGGRAGAQRHAGEEVAKNCWRTRALELCHRAAHHGLGKRLCDGSRGGDRAHGAAQDKRHDHGGLVGTGVGTCGLGHGAVPQQRRVDVDIAQDHTVLVHKIGTEYQAGHVDGILGALLGRDRAHEGLVGVLDMRIHHVQVALVDRYVGRFTHRAPRVVQPGAGIGQLDEVLEVGQCAVAAASVQVHHKG